MRLGLQAILFLWAGSISPHLVSGNLITTSGGYSVNSRQIINLSYRLSPIDTRKDQKSVSLLNGAAYRAQGKPLRVRFCDLVRRPELYDQQMISVAAIEIRQIAPVVDGGDSYLYKPQCDNAGSYLLLEADPTHKRNVAALKKADLIISRARKQKHGQARFSLRLTGRFIVAKEGKGFGHLDWAHFKLSVTGEEWLREVPEKTPWPLTFRRSKRHR